MPLPEKELAALVNQIETNAVKDVAEMRKKFAYVFGDTKERTTPVQDHGVKLEIRLNGQYKRTKYYSVARNMEQHVLPILEEMEANGVIERSTTGAYVAPILVVKKKKRKVSPVYGLQGPEFGNGAVS